MRYLGNKKTLIFEIDSLISEKISCGTGDINDKIFCDAFCGTGTVSDHFKEKYKIVINDNLYVSYAFARGKLSNNIQFNGLSIDPFIYFNTQKYKKGFVYENYAPDVSGRMYFSNENAMKIDYIRTKIEEWYKGNKINDDEYYYLIASLIESVSKVSNVAGVYGAYLKKWDNRALKEMKFIRVERNEKNSKFSVDCYNDDVELLIDDVAGDILYLDPPYTANHYHIQYHVLETIARYDKPEIKGITGARGNWELTYNFSKKQNVHISFERLIAKAKFKHIIVSYSSKGIMSKEYIEAVLKRYGIESTYDFRKIEYKKYQNSKTENSVENFEYLFYIEKKSYDLVKYSSPLNYIGGKGSMIDFINTNLPSDIDTFIDVFGGGFNVGINVNANKIIYNDINFKVVELIEMFKKEDTINIIKYIERTIKKYNLEKNGKEQYIELRTKYNETKVKNIKMLYVLILFGFQQQIRFNSKYEFNNPVGQASFNDLILEKIVSFSRVIREKKILIESIDFRDFTQKITPETFFYFDPPYLITLGSYNDGKRGFKGWSENDELDLLNMLDLIHDSGSRFMLSNVLYHKEKENIILLNWLEKNSHRYKVIKFNGNARNRNEVIIINY